MKNALNFLLFQIGWFATVLSVANQLELLAAVSVLTIIAIHLLLIDDKFNEIYLVIAAGLAGFIIDSVLIANDVFATSGVIALEEMAPLWLIMLWMLFSITINHSLGWLRKSYWLAGVLGFIFAPFAYYVGQKFEVLTFSGSYTTGTVLAIIGVTWAIATPLLIFVSHAISTSQLNPAKSQ